MAAISLKIFDTKSGSLQPCWINLRNLSGNNYSPVGWEGHVSVISKVDVGGRVMIGGHSWFAISGSCELPGGVGDCILSISLNPEFNSIQHPLNLYLGRLACRVSVSLPGSEEVPGFVAADLRVQNTSAGVALFEAKSANIQLVQLLAGISLEEEDKQSLSTLAELQGFGGLVWREGCLVSGGTLNQQGVCGSLALLDCHRPVFPLGINNSNAQNWSIFDWTAQCHRVRGVVVWADTDRDIGHQAEAICAALEGEIDAYEVIDFDTDRPGGLKLWFQLANSGCFLPLVGASAKSRNTTCVGSTRTWIQLENSNSWKAGGKGAQESWVLGIKKGRTSVSKLPFFFTNSITKEKTGWVVEVVIGGLPDDGFVEILNSDGTVASKVDLVANLECNQIAQVRIEGNFSHIAAVLKNCSGNIISHDSFVALPNWQQGPNSSNLDTSELQFRIQEGIDWAMQVSSGEPSGEMLYRLDLFSRCLKRLRGEDRDFV